MEKVAVITGGIRRLGRKISYFLSDKGYDLAIIYNSSSKLELLKTSKVLKSKGNKFKFYKCDIRNLGKVKSTIKQIGQDFRKIDILVNNSGIIKKIDFTKITENIFDETLSVNLRSMLFISQYSLPLLQKSTNALIINFASIGGLLNWTNYIPYSISKAGVIKLTKLLAKRLAPKIRVNAIAPGTIEIKGEESNTPKKVPFERIPLKKYGNPDDILSAVKFLIESNYVTGQTVTIDGGRSIN